jgi:ABC-2 type transport system ATP-binding protein
MIEARGLTKRYGRAVAAAGLSFEVLPGCVTGFLGANGSGKSTTMRMIMGLDAPDTGQATRVTREGGALRRPGGERETPQ